MIDLGKKNVLYAGDQLVNKLYLGNKKIEDYRVIELNNLVKNGDFSNGKDNWNANVGYLINSSQYAQFDNGRGYAYVFQDIPMDTKGILYISGLFSIDRGMLYGLFDYGSYANANLSLITSNGFHSRIINHVNNNSRIAFGTGANSNNNSGFKDIKIINLTHIFGEGNEPTKEWCDQYINFFIKNKQGIRL